MTAPGESSLDVGPEYGGFPPPIPTGRPTPARCYDYGLGGKDNFAVDRQLVIDAAQQWPGNLDLARHNRRFLYRAVRFLARDAGIGQFLDLGSGLPTQNNVHEVAQAFQPDARVVYVDNDPIVLAHGRALLADDQSTTVIDADMTRPDEVLDHEETQRLIDFDQPLGILLFGVPHCIADESAVRRMIDGPMARAVAGSYVAFSHVASDSREDADALTAFYTERGMEWRTRVPAEIEPWFSELEVVEPGLGPVRQWRPDPDQPPLAEVDEPLRPFVGTSEDNNAIYEFGGVLRKPV
ncbi:SAM-dependent methyltransferase [Spiractinospora alimapuensis]|uniref:SAM-dependent methyltransferase n=1 Tax=Spiractinospora alimapuensis TaxID=2820884 RepID=UPI001F3D23DB|nr:SAM-dependent methyltransferase [Spiractinospora alimapuensis]QVQ54412.1 SAM-dependent methyltransferase [Spiractinospora alimapuensis]